MAEHDTLLVLSFEADAIRDHFDGCDSAAARWVAAASDADLKRVGLDCLGSDILYDAFHEVLVLAVEDEAF